MRFDIQPYVGALPVAFGMRKENVHRLIGDPNASFPIWNRTGFSEHYDCAGFNVGYDNDWVVNHLGFGPGKVELSIQERPIWTMDSIGDPNPILLEFDPEPIEFVGIWFYLKIGVTTTGYHDDDENQLAITVFSRANCDSKADLLAKGQAADTTKYIAK